MRRTSSIRRTVAIATVTVTSCLALATPAAAGPVTVAAAGDIARPNEPKPPQEATADLILDRIRPDRVLMLGDAQYLNGEYHQFLRSYDPSWGRFFGKTEPVPGNHEYDSRRARGFYRYFENRLKRHEDSASDHRKGWYSFDLGRWHIVALNTNCDDGVKCGPEKKWLRKDLRADRHACQLVFGHHARKPFIRVAAREKADLFLNGHKHTYERWDRSLGTKIRQFVVGTGGFSLGAPSVDADAGVEEFGVLKLTLRGRSYVWRFLDINGAVRDSGSATCRN